jgi:succinoglycan biosynthesis transport protein ExoP
MAFCANGTDGQGRQLVSNICGMEPRRIRTGPRFPSDACLARQPLYSTLVTERTIVLPPSPDGNGHDSHYRLTMMVPKRRFLSYVRERWWAILICLVLTLGSVVVYETVRSEKYNSYARLYLSGDVQLGPTAVFTEDQNYFGTQIELVKSARLQRAAAEQLGAAAMQTLKEPIDIEVIRPMATSLLQLRATGSDPALTQRFLQALVQEYLAYKKETRKITSEDMVVSLTEQLALREKELQAEQDKWAEFQKTNNVAVMEEEGKSAGLYLAELNLQLAKFRLEQALLRQSLETAIAAAPTFPQVGLTNVDAGQAAPATAESAPPPGQPAATNSVGAIDDAALKSARLDLAVLLGDKEDKVRYLGERKFAQEVARLQRLVSILEEENRSGKAAALKELEQRMAAIEAAIPSLETKVLDINERLARAQRLKTNIQREQGYYDHLLSTLQNVDLNRNVQQERLSVLEPPSPGQPEKRDLPLRIVLAVIGGLALGLGIVFVWHLLDDRFVSVRDIKDQFGETMLGLVPQIKVSRARPQEALLGSGDSRLAYVESYRHLRSALLLSSPGESRPQTLLLTSAGPAEGKTTIAINLARLLARSGLRVVLVDADVRAGATHRLLDAEAQLGVLDYLRGDADASAIVHATDVEGLSYVPGGTHNEQSEGLLLSPKLSDLMCELRQDRDFVILDGAPILMSDDAALLVPHADAVVLVTRPFHTRSRLIRQALDMLYQRQAKHVSMIFNRARADDVAGYYAMNGSTNPARNGKVL